MRAYRLIPAVVLVLVLGAAAQTSQPETDQGNQNRNEPSIHIQGSPGAPATSPPAPASAPAAEPPSGTAGNAGQQSPGQPAPAPSTAASPAGEKQQQPSSSAQPKSDQPKSDQPQTQILPAADAPANSDPLLETAPLPTGSATLVGGTAEKVDRIRNRVVVQPFGGGKRMDVRFDERSHFYRDGRETTILAIKRGDRVYADTMLVDGKIFARSLRVRTESGPVEARGQITEYDASTGKVTMRDQLTSQPIHFTLNAKTSITRQAAPMNISELRPGALIDVLFSPGGGSSDARQLEVLALPGSNYMFEGRVTHVDLRSGTLAVQNQSDNKNYEIHFDPGKIQQPEMIVVDAEIAANTVFDGHSYRAQTISVEKPTSAPQ